MKPSTKKTLKKIYPRYKTNFMNYYEADTFYIEIFTNLRKVVKIQALNEKQAIDRIVEKQETRTIQYVQRQRTLTTFFTILSNKNIPYTYRKFLFLILSCCSSSRVRVRISNSGNRAA